MKTLEQVKKHVAETCYSKDEWNKIWGFLLGRFPNQEIDIYFAEPNSFQDFLEWFENNDKKDADVIKEPRYKYTGEKRAKLERVKFVLSYWNGYLQDDKIQSKINKIDASLNETVD